MTSGSGYWFRKWGKSGEGAGAQNSDVVSLVDSRPPRRIDDEFIFRMEDIIDGMQRGEVTDVVMVHRTRFGDIVSDASVGGGGSSHTGLIAGLEAMKIDLVKSWRDKARKE